MILRSLCRAAIAALCVSLSTFWSSAASAQSFAPAALALAPAGTVPGELKIDVLNVIPDDALGFVIASDIEGTRKSVEGVLRKLTIPFEAGEGYAEFDAFLEKLAGWDAEGGHALVFLASTDGSDDPNVAAMIPVTDYNAFLESLKAKPGDDGLSEFEFEGNRSVVGQKANYAVIGDEEYADVVKHVIESKSSVAPSCESLRPWLAKQQIAGVMMPSTIQMGCDAMLKELDTEKMFRNVGQDEAKFVKVVAPVIKALRILLEDVRVDMTHLAIGARLDENIGAALNFQAVFKPEGKFAALAKNSPVLPPDYFLNLPDKGDLYVAVAMVGSEGAGETIFALVDEVLDEAATIDDLPFDVAKLKLALSQFRATAGKVKLTTTAQNAGGEGFYDGAFEIIRVDDAAEYVEQQRKTLETLLSAFDKLGDKLPDIKVEKKQVQGLEAVVVSINMIDLMEKLGMPRQNETDMMFKSMFGGDGTMTMYVAAASPDTAVMAYTEADLKAVADSVKNDERGLADDVLIKKTAALLPNDASMIGFFGMRGYIEQIKKMVFGMMAAQGQAFPLQIPEFPESPPIGFAATLRGNTIGFNVVVPMQLMEDTRDYAMQMIGIFGGAFR